MATTSKRRVRAQAEAGAEGKAGRRSSTKAFEGALKRQVAEDPRYVLRLYIAGTTPRSVQAVEVVRAVCEEHLAGRCDLRVIDIYQQPASAAENQIIAAPTLVKERPLPSRRMVGDFSSQAKLLACLHLAPEEVKP
jgi:circadian clock protein KaiB